MKVFLLSWAIVLLASEKTCQNKKTYDKCFKGRLEIKANCMNYTISILEGRMDTSLYVSEWSDESTAKSYKNVFELGSKCNFPSDIKEGDEFYFEIDSISQNNCSVCMMYYPVPGKKINIRVLEKECE